MNCNPTKCSVLRIKPLCFVFIDENTFIRLRPRITRKCFFSAERMHWMVANFRENPQLILGDKKTIDLGMFQFYLFFHRPHNFFIFFLFRCTH